MNTRKFIVLLLALVVLGLVYAPQQLLSDTTLPSNPSRSAFARGALDDGVETPTPTDTDIPTETPTPTDTETPTLTPTLTDTPTDVPTITATPTLTDTPTDMPTMTATPTATLTLTPSPTVTATPTYIPGVHLSHGPVVGAVTAASARVFVRTNDRAIVKIRYSSNPNLSGSSESITQETGADHDFTAILPLSNLQPNTIYYLDVIVNGASQLHTPYPQFKTFPPAGSNVPFKFVYLTDSSVLPKQDAKSFVNAAQNNPDFVILGGDFPHGKSINIIAKRFFYKALYDPATSPSIRDFVANILRRYPVAHMWDNHDYGMPSNKKYPLRQVNLQVLQEYFPTYPLTQYGDWQKFSYAQADFFMLDSRSQRDPNHTPGGPGKSMLDGDKLGAKGQLEWLKQGLLQSTARWKFILSPVPFNPTAKPKTSWGRFPDERNEIMQFIHDNHITGVLSVTGDLHLGAIDDGTHATIPEMVVPGPNGPGCQSTAQVGLWSQGVYGKEDEHCNGYGVITVETNPPSVLFQVKDADGKTRLKYRIQ